MPPSYSQVVVGIYTSIKKKGWIFYLQSKRKLCSVRSVNICVERGILLRRRFVNMKLFSAGFSSAVDAGSCAAQRKSSDRCVNDGKTFDLFFFSDRIKEPVPIISDGKCTGRTAAAAANPRHGWLLGRAKARQLQVVRCLPDPAILYTAGI